MTILQQDSFCGVTVGKFKGLQPVHLESCGNHPEGMLSERDAYSGHILF